MAPLTISQEFGSCEFAYVTYSVATFMQYWPSVHFAKFPVLKIFRKLLLIQFYLISTKLYRDTGNDYQGGGGWVQLGYYFYLSW